MGISRALAAYVLRNLCGSMRIRLNNGLEQQVVHDLHVQVFSALQRFSISFYENRPTGEIMSRVLNDTEHMQRIFVDGLEEIITAGLTLIGIMVVLFMLNWKLALLALVPIPLLVVGAALFTKRVHGHYREIRKGCGRTECPPARCAGRHPGDDGIQSSAL